MRVLTRYDDLDERLIDEHVAMPAMRPPDRALVRLNMISSADGGSAVEGVSGGLGNRNDHAVFAALRDRADTVLVGLSTVVAEHYHPPDRPDLRLLVVAPEPDPSGDPDLFASGRATFVLGKGAPSTPPDVPDLRVGDGPLADLSALVRELNGQVVLLEGGPSLAGAMVALGLVDEFFHTTAPMVVAGESARVVHGPPADAQIWGLMHGFCDDTGYLFLRYARG
jgi:riboflavin biosynthesis pyrimidine reductase